MKRPLLTVAVLYVSGLLIADVVPFELTSLLCCSFATGVVALACGSVRPYLLGLLIMLVGASNLTLHKAILSPYDLRVLIGEKAELVTIRGRLVQTPSQRLYEFGETENWRTVGQIELESIRRNNSDWEPAYARVAFSVPDVLAPNFFAGVRVEATGVVAPPKRPIAQGIFDYRSYLVRQGIHYQLRTESTNSWRVVPGLDSPQTASLTDRFVAWAKVALASGLPNEDEPLHLLWAMTLGLRPALTDEVALPFMRSGTMHIFAISGLHVALIAGMLVSILRVVQIPRSICGLVVIPLLWFYTGATGWHASAIRATVMMSVVILGWMLKRPSDLLNSLGAAALLILIWQPFQLFQASFQLSFAVVLSLALLTPHFQQLWQRLTQPDPFLPDELRPRWQRLLLRSAYWFGAGLATSLAAWLGSAPLIAYYFHLVTPVTLFANVVVVPLAGLALASAVASLVTVGWFAACATLFNNSAWFWMLLVSKVSQAAAALPFGHFYVRSPPPIAFVFYYGTLLAVLSGVLKRRKLRTWLVIGLAVSGVLATVQWLRERSMTRLTVLPLSGGHAVYFEPGWWGKDMLIDCGSASAAEFVLAPFLRARGVDRLSTFLLTHGHANQISGAAFVAEQFYPAQIATNMAKFKSPVYRNTIAQLVQARTCRLGVSRGDRLGAWRVLHPEPADSFQHADDAALVLLGTIGHTRVLLLSDLGWLGQRRLMERNPALAADIVITGLPADVQPLTESLLEAVKPKLVIVADSEFPATRRASAELRRRLSGRPFQVLYTSQVGSVQLTFGKNNWEVRTAL